MHARSFPHRDGAPTPPPRRHRCARAGANLAATAVAPLVHVPSSQQPQGSLVRLSCGDQTRWRQPRRRQGRAAPPSPLGTFRRTPWTTFKTAGGLLCTRGATHRCGRSRSARIRCGPPLISRPHTGPHGSKPHRPPPDPMRRPVAGRAAARAAGIPAAPAIRGSRAAGPVKGGGLIYLNSGKWLFPLINPRKSILTPKIVKPLPENF
jgi:hypothetical protein